MNLERENDVVELDIFQIFSQIRYVIPIYQRNYAWKQLEIEQLLNDIDEFDYCNEGEYFLGNLILDERDNKSFVIDGQQRLTTLYLLLSYLKNSKILEIDFRQESLTFEAREKSNNTLELIYKNEIEKLDDSRWNYYTDEIVSGYKIIEQFFLSKESNEENNDVSKFIKKLKKIKLLKIEVPEGINLNHYFEIMNTRGEQLEVHEIAKANILKNIIDESERKTAGIIWDMCSDMSSYIQMCFDNKIRSEIFGSSDKTNKQLDSFNLHSFEEIHNIIVATSDKNNNFSDKDYSSMYTLKEMLNGKIKSQGKLDEKIQEEQGNFVSILDFPNFILQVNAVISDENDRKSLDDKYFIETMKQNWSNEDRAKRFIYSLLKCRYIFDKFIIKREYDSSSEYDGKWSLKKLNSKYENNKLSLSYNETFESYLNTLVLTLQACMRITYTSPSSMNWITEVLKMEQSDLLNEEYSKDSCNENTLIGTLERYCVERIGNYTTYRGFAVPRIVFTYLDYILWRDHKNNKDYKDDWNIIFRNSIEHFHPQNPAGDVLRWEDDILHTFGNLALVNTISNSKFSNLSPMSKVDTFKELINQSPKLQLMESLVKEDGWTRDVVKRHEEEMYNILKSEISRFE